MLLPDIGDALLLFSLGSSSAVRLVCFDVCDKAFKVGGCIHSLLAVFSLLLSLYHLFLVKRNTIIHLLDV